MVGFVTTFSTSQNVKSWPMISHSRCFEEHLIHAGKKYAAFVE